MPPEDEGQPYLPAEVADGEKIVRAILTPFHFDPKKKQLKHQAFRSKAGIDEVSVMRLNYLSADFCKRKAIEIEANAKAANEKSKAAYIGLAVLTADAVRAHDAEVVDSREEFWGHAHISHGITLQPNEPPDSENAQILTERCRKLIAPQVTTFHQDLEPAAENWTGQPL